MTACSERQSEKCHSVWSAFTVVTGAQAERRQIGGRYSDRSVINELGLKRSRYMLTGSECSGPIGRTRWSGRLSVDLCGTLWLLPLKLLQLT